MAAIPGINFSIVLSQSPATFLFSDTGVYPSGVPQNIVGYVVVTTPDGVTTTYGSFSAPFIYWGGGGLIQNSAALALAGDMNFQKGGYTIAYHIRATGYDDTTLTKVFQLTFNRPTVIIDNNFDLFTPNLSVEDSTAYEQDGMDFYAIIRTWSALIHSASGTDRTITGSQQSLSVAYLGQYYDAQYAITLTVKPLYKLNTPDDWVTLAGAGQATLSLQAQIPPGIDTLNDLMQTLKNQADAEMNTGNGETLKDRFTYASALYDDFRRKGCDASFAGLTKTLLQLLKVFNNNVNPVYTNTNAVIPAYDFQCPGSSGSVAWGDITGKPSTEVIEWTVLASGGSLPTNGQSVLTDARLLNVPFERIILVRNNPIQFGSNQGDGDTYFTKVTVDNFLTAIPSFNTGEKIICIILAL